MISTRPVRLGAALVAVALALVACSSNGSSGNNASPGNNASTPGGNGSADQPLQTIKIVTGGSGTYNSAVYIAQVLGFAKDEGVDLQIKTVSQDVIVNLITSGQADLSLNGPGSMMPVAQAGKQPEIVWAMQSSAAASFVIGQNSVKSLADCKRVATNPPGGGGYNGLVLYKDALQASYQIIPIGDINSITASVISGQNDCAMAGLQALQPVIDKGEAHLIVDPRKPSELPNKLLLNAAGDGLWGIKTNLDTKKTALIGLMKALTKANAWLRTHTPAQIAEALHKQSDMSTQTVPFIETTYGADGPFLLTKPGADVITPERWAADLKLYGVTFPYASSGTGAFSYANMVNMTYLKAATQ